MLVTWTRMVMERNRKMGKNGKINRTVSVPGRGRNGEQFSSGRLGNWVDCTAIYQDGIGLVKYWPGEKSSPNVRIELTVIV